MRGHPAGEDSADAGMDENARIATRIGAPRRVLALSALVAVIALAACGQSDEDKAKESVCNARDDIQAQVKKLSNLTLTTATADQVRSSLQAIGNDLTKINDARDQLDDRRRQQVEQATAKFTSQVRSVAADLGKSLSVEGAAQQLKTDFAQLAAVYKESFATIDCG
jgi:hypothetical protein